MTDREKLCELVCERTNHDSVKHCNLSSASKCYSCTSVADHLLANGVTVQQWISVEDRLPEEDLYCLVFRTFGYMRDGVVSLATYFSRYKGLSGDPMNTKQVWCKYSSEVGYYDISDSVTHWMPLPEPPKEDKHA